MQLVKNFQILFLLLFIALSSSKITIPKKESFTPINSNALTLMELKDGQRELYFTFENKFEQSDIVINLKKAKQYTTRLYFYDSYESIKTNSADEFTNFIEELDLSEKLLYLKGYKKKTYYIVIKDLGNYSAKDYFSIFNEQDTLELKPDEPFTINLFLSKNLYTFTFKGEKDETISIEMNINDRDFSESVAIYLNDELLYQGERNRGLIKLNEEKTTGGTYTLYISSTNDEVYIPIKSSIILYKEKNEVIKLEPKKEVNLYYVNSKGFNLYAEIDDYELNEENILTFKFTHNAVKNKLIDFCSVKNMNFKEFDNNKFVSNMPAHDEDSEGDFSRLNSLDNVYHLYFKRTQPKEEEKKSYLLIYCKINIDEDLYFDPENINVYLSPRAINLDLSDKQYLKNDFVKINEKITINDYTPQIYKINIPPSDSYFNKLSYVFYTNTQIQTIYEDTMMNTDHTNENLRQIFAISSKNFQKNKILFIKLFGANQEINFKVESTYSDIYYIQDNIRPTNKVLSRQHLNCGNSFYYIGSYSNLAEDTYYYLEEIYGKYNLYYKNEVTDKDDDTILTNADKKYLIDSKTGTFSKAFDIIELKCQSPGYFNFHLLNTYFTKTLTMYQRQVAYASKGELYIYPKVNEGQTKINLEVSSPLGNEVEVNVYDNSNTVHKIDSKNKYFQITYKKAEDVPSYIKLNVLKDNTLLSTKLTDSNLYKVVEDTNRAKINEERILFKLENKQDYKSVNITLKRVTHDYSYTMFRGDIAFAYDPIISGHDTVSIGDNNYINIFFSNPYLKQNSMTPDKEGSPFYIMFYVNDPEGVQKDIYMNYLPVDQYEEMPNSVSKILAVKGEKYSLNIGKDISKISVLYQPCGNSLKGLNIFSYDDILNAFEVKNKYNAGSFNNYLIPNQIGPIFEKEEGNQYTGAVVGVSLNEISQSDIDRYNNFDYGVRQNGKVLKWNKVDGVKEYIVYVFNKQNEDIKYIHNPCYLDFVQRNNYVEKNENDTTYVASYSTKKNSYEVKEIGLYVTTVMANIEGKMPMKFIYNELNYNSSAEPYDEDEDESHALLIALCILIPIIIILIVVLIVILIRRKKEKELSAMPEEREKLVRDTYTTSNNISNRDD